MSPGPPAPLEKEVTDPEEGTEKRTELASRLDTITLGKSFCEEILSTKKFSYLVGGREV